MTESRNDLSQVVATGDNFDARDAPKLRQEVLDCVWNRARRERRLGAGRPGYSARITMQSNESAFRLAQTLRADASGNPANRARYQTWLGALYSTA